jgi:hypothetical protein
VSKRISKALREDAALICAVAASHGPEQSYSFGEVTASLGVGREAEALAREAIDSAICLPASPGPDLQRIDWAEAESLLRCGWSPGDEP